MNKKIILFFFIILIILFGIWSPWITTGYAKQKVITEFNKKWYGVNDGCSLSENVTSFRGLFGVYVTLSYDCGFKIYTEDISPSYKKNVFVSSLGTISNMP